MNKLKFEKFEMKYGYFLPDDFKSFMNKFGGGCYFGSCSFEYLTNMISNTVRIYGKMDFHLFPFGFVGNGDYYCFYKYGENREDYFVGIWLHETNNFVILCKTFKAFIYRCVLDDYFSTIVTESEVCAEDAKILEKESLERCYILSKEYKFDFEKIKKIESQNDYHKLMVEYDPFALQSLCYLGKSYLENNNEIGIEYLNQAKKICSYYMAPYYILGNYYSIKDKTKMKSELLEGIQTSLSLTGYSYWEEDYIDIPKNAHENIATFLKNEKIYIDPDIYDYNFRLKIANEFKNKKMYKEALREYANALYCSEDYYINKDILEKSLKCCIEGGINYLSKIIQYDIKFLKL